MSRCFRSSRHLTCAGFTIIEVMIVMSILFSGLLALAMMQLDAMRGGNRGRHATHASTVAQSQMERLQRLPWTSLNPTADWTDGIVVSNTVKGEGDETEQSYTLAWKIADDISSWTRTIDVRVSWDDPAFPNRSITLSSIRYNREGL